MSKNRVKILLDCRGPYIGKYPPPLPLGEGKNISRGHFGTKYEKVKRKRGKM
jgi:hypothetical protein